MATLTSRSIKSNQNWIYCSIIAFESFLWNFFFLCQGCWWMLGIERYDLQDHCKKKENNWSAVQMTVYFWFFGLVILEDVFIWLIKIFHLSTWLIWLMWPYNLGWRRTWRRCSRTFVNRGLPPRHPCNGNSERSKQRKRGKCLKMLPVVRWEKR